jgi:hypothetical protein
MGKVSVFTLAPPPISLRKTTLLIKEKKFCCNFGTFVPPLHGGHYIFQSTVFTTSSSVELLPKKSPVPENLA